MKLIALVVEKYGDVFEKQIFNFSDEFKVDFDFSQKSLLIEKNPDYIEHFYGESIYNFTPVVGINGTGKTRITNMIGRYFNHQFQVSDISENDCYFTVLKDSSGELFIDSNNLHPENVSSRNHDVKTYLDYIRNEDRLPRATYRPRGVYDSQIDSVKFSSPLTAYLELSKLGMITSELRFTLEINYYNFREAVQMRTALELLVYNLIELVCYGGKKIWNNEKKGFDIIPFPKEWRDAGSQIRDYGNISHVKKLVDGLDEEEYFDFITSFIELFEVIQFLSSVGCCKIGEGNELTYNSPLIFIDFLYNKKYNSEFEKLFKSLSKITGYNNLSRDLVREIHYYMSTGETNLLKLCSRINQVVESDYQLKPHEHYIFVIDEIETGLHLEWSRKLTKFLTDYIDEKKKEVQENNPTSDFPTFQFIFTTHSPYMLSDIKPGNILSLKKNKETGFSEVQPYQNTFAKNIQEIMHDDMFITNIYGEFAIRKINRIISDLSFTDRCYIGEKQKELEKEISLIAEPLLKNKLLDMYHAIYVKKEKEDEILRLINDLPSERKTKILEKLASQQKNL